MTRMTAMSEIIKYARDIFFFSSLLSTPRTCVFSAAYSRARHVIPAGLFSAMKTEGENSPFVAAASTRPSKPKTPGRGDGDIFEGERGDALSRGL